MVNFSLLAAEIVSLVWGTPANFNGFHVLTALLHGTLVVGVSQTLLRWTEGATYIRQGDHHVVSSANGLSIVMSMFLPNNCFYSFKLHNCTIKSASDNYLSLHHSSFVCLQCFDTVGWASGRASGLYKNWVMRCWHGHLEQDTNGLHMVQQIPLPPHHLLHHYNPEWFDLSGASLPRLSLKRGRQMGVSLSAVLSHWITVQDSILPHQCLIISISYWSSKIQNHTSHRIVLCTIIKFKQQAATEILKWKWNMLLSNSNIHEKTKTKTILWSANDLQ